MKVPKLYGRRLSALIVNHNSGAWTQRCVESLQHAWVTEGGQPEDLEIVVLDSGSGLAESTWWRSLENSGVRVRTSPANVGYATGLNMAYEISEGAPQDVVALLNPDLYFLPGSIGPLLKRLEENPRTGAVQPRIFLDEEKQILLPPNELPTPGRELFEALAARFPRLARWRSERKTKRAADFWSTQEIQARGMLSGACLFMRRSTIESLGGVMDGHFPLYFEDADLCTRLTRAGFSLEVEPRSQILHHWSRCAGPGFVGEVAARHAHGRSLYMSKHHPGLWSTLMQFCTSQLNARTAERSAKCMHPVTDLGSVHESPRFEFSQDGEHLLEISLTPFWGLCAGTFVSGEDHRYSPEVWSWLFPGVYYVRAVDAASGAFLGAWRFEKPDPARCWPLELCASYKQSVGSRKLAMGGERVG